MSKVSFLASARTRTRARVARGAVGRAAVSARPAVYARTKHKTKRIIVSLSFFFSFHSSLVVVPAPIRVARQPREGETWEVREGGIHVTVYPYRRRSPSIHPPSRDNPEKGVGNGMTERRRRHRRRRPIDADDADESPARYSHDITRAVFPDRTASTSTNGFDESFIPTFHRRRAKRLDDANDGRLCVHARRPGATSVRPRRGRFRNKKK